MKPCKSPGVLLLLAGALIGAVGTRADTPSLETAAEAASRRVEVARLLADGVLRVDERGYVRLTELVARDPEDLLCFKENLERGARYEARAAAEKRSVESVCREADRAGRQVPCK